MAVKGTEAKTRLMNKIIAAIPAEDYAGCLDKKYYFWSMEDGVRTQVCLTLTCPKTPIEIDEGNKFIAASMECDNRLNFEDMPTDTIPVMIHMPKKNVQVSDEEKENLKKLLKELDL